MSHCEHCVAIGREAVVDALRAAISANAIDLTVADLVRLALAIDVSAADLIEDERD